MDEPALGAALASSRERMEALAEQLRGLIASQPPHQLLGYLYGQRLMGAMRDGEDAAAGVPHGPDKDAINQLQFVLEYVHAVWAGTPGLPDGRLDEAVANQIIEVAEELRARSMSHCLVSAARTESGVFGASTAEIEFIAKTTWVMLRGNRYQVLEEEFYSYVLAPHDDALRRVYGIPAQDIARGFQRMADSVRMGHMQAALAIEEQMAAAARFAAAEGIPAKAAVEEWKVADPEGAAAAAAGFQDLLLGGVCNMSRHSGLPDRLLTDLAFQPGDEQDFFAPGDYCGTPMRTLPARKKPLIALPDGYYAPDPSFIRDAGYRALLWNLLRRDPGYRELFKDRQQALSESAFVDILAAHFSAATVFRSIWYRDPHTNQWVENDLLVLLDDVLLLVEAKAGAAASIASPAADFSRHAQSVEDLILKAYAQCKRFFDYLASAEEVPIFTYTGGRYVEAARLRRASFRVAFPIGLTVESFSPYSAMCKELPGVAPLLGRHAFISLSIDDLFVLGRFLPTTGEFLHYLEVRQRVAALPKVKLFDEMDHLGAYVGGNRFDLELQAQLAEGAALVAWDGMSDVVDRHFEEVDWATRAAPAQPYPEEVRQLLAALRDTGNAGWLSVDSAIRDYGTEGREDLAALLRKCRGTLDQHVRRFFYLGGEPSLFVWIQREGTAVDLAQLQFKAAAARLAVQAADQLILLAHAGASGGYFRVEHIPAGRYGDSDSAQLLAEAQRLKERVVPVPQVREVARVQAPHKPPGRNQPCWCGSGVKFKKCHGSVDGPMS